MSSKKVTVSKSKSKSNKRAVVVCTKQRAVVFGFAEETTGEQIVLTSARNCFYWAPAPGLFSLASEGPRPGSKVGATADRVELRDIAAVLDCSPKATKAWTGIKSWIK